MRHPWPCLALAVVLPIGRSAAQPNPVTNGSFELLDPEGQPTDWQTLGSARVEAGEAHTGTRALHLVRTPETQGEVGLNRGWAPNSGAQGAMLAERRGGIRFWYKAVAAEPAGALTIQAIPMNETPLEVGGRRVVWQVPPVHVGDGQWHQGEFAYDYTARDDIRWVHVSARLVGESGDLWLDDFEWTPEAGPALQATGLELTETKGREGDEATVTLTLGNPGGRPVPAGTATLELPPGLAATPAEAAFAEIAPGKTTEATWTLTGRRTQAGVKLAATARAGGQEAGASIALAPRVTLGELRVSRMIVKPDEPVSVALLARNAGTSVAEGLRARLTGPEGLRIEAEPAGTHVRPGIDEVVGSWRVTAGAPTPLARVRATLDGVEGELTSPLVVAGRLPGGVPESLSLRRGGVRLDAQWAALGSDRTRLVFVREAAGVGVGALQVLLGDAWRTVAYLPRLGLLADEQGDVPLTGQQANAAVGSGKGQITLGGTAEAGGAAWRLRWVLTAERGSRAIGYRLEATPDKDARITALEGPMLYAGEGEAPEREDAILPGLEWLVKDEESSNALDTVPDHPDCVRYVPHPYKVTIPAVGVKVGDAAVGLLWDTPQAQPSVGLAGPLSVVFASPDRFEGHVNHLMGLSLPSVGHGVPENERRATEPLRVKAGQTLVISAWLFAQADAPDSLAVLDEWFARHGYPEPLPYPRGDLRKELEFSLSGYFKDRALWNPEWGKWYSDLIVGFRPDAGPAYQLLRSADVLATGEVADQARALAAEVLGGDERARGLQLQHRASPDAILAQARSVRGLIASQHEDGTWRFGGDQAGEWPEEGVNYEVLGPEGASEVGLTAASAARVLEFALLTGDAGATAAGLKALEAMRSFRVPRAAQVWEVPVHTPDILASAQATDAYLAGYRLTGDAQWLKEAIYWARSGLPFVYVWSAPDQPAMQGASIPVFGATAYVLSWFGVAVQWNGLAYASAVQDLAPYDSSFPWQRVADSLFRSAMYQQATEGDRLAQWPDAMNFVVPRKGAHGQTPPCFQPSTVISGILRAMGLQTGLTTVAARQGDEHLAVRAMAALEDVTWKGAAVRFTAAFAPTQAGAIEVIGTAKPREVRVNGRPLAEAVDPWAGAAPAWRWLEPTADVEIRVTEPGAYRVEVIGVSRVAIATLPPLRAEIDFRFDQGLDGWQALNHLEPLRIEDGALRTVTTGTDPYMARDGLLVEGRPGDEVVIRLALTGGGDGATVYWATAASGGITADQCVGSPVPHGGAIHEVRVPVGGHAKWAGQTVTTLRIDPGGGTIGSEVTIESVRLERR